MATDDRPGPEAADMERIAGAILNGDAVDWAAVRASAASPASLLAQLRTLSEVCDFYRQLPAGGDGMPPGTHWGHLKIEQRVGGGAFGDVYRAWDSRLDRQVALKLLHPDAWPDADVTSSLVAEARLLAKVRHENVVTVYGAERIDGRIGLWMELVPGRTLAEDVRENGPVSVDHAVDVAIRLCGALDAIHQAGLIHGDVKAQNVVREAGGRIVLMDFGAGTDQSTGILPGTPAGTPLYAAPEILEGRTASSQSDLYSLGVLIYYLLAGRFPVSGASLAEIRSAHATADRRLPSDVPRRVAHVIESGLSVDPQQRPPTAAQFAESLRRAHTPRRFSWTAAVVMLAAVATATALLGEALVGQNGTDSDRARSAALTGRQRIPAPPWLLLGRPPLDGDRLAFSDLDGNLATFDLTTYTPMRVVAAAQGQSSEFSASSPDGTLIAHQVALADGRYELRLASTAGGQSRTLVEAGWSSYPIPLQWSADGSQLLTMQSREDGARDLALIRISDGHEQRLRRFTRAVPFEASLSPDGRFVAFDFPEGGDAGNRNVLAMDVVTGVTTPITSHAANDVFPVWAPDSEGLFFVSDRGGALDGWLQPVSAGAAIGTPRLVARNLGDVSPLGFTSDGSLYYLTRPSPINVTLADWDDATLDARNARILPARIQGISAQPVWSPDGRSLAYIGLRGSVSQDRGGHVLVVRDLRSGREREFAHDLKFALPAPEWSADGSSIVLRGADRSNRRGAFRVDVASGAVTRLDGVPDTNGITWSRAGRNVLAYARGGSIIRHDLDTGQNAPILTGKDSAVQFVNKFAESPTDARIAYSGPVTGSTRGTTLRIAGPDGIRELVRTPPGEAVVFQCWTPDGRHVLFTRLKQGVAEPHRLWVAAADGSDLHMTDLTIAGWTQANGVTLDPSGRRLAFTTGDVSEELWRLSNFLHQQPGAARF